MRTDCVLVRRFLLKNGSVLRVSDETPTHLSGKIENDVSYVYIPKTYVKKQVSDAKVTIDV